MTLTWANLNKGCRTLKESVMSQLSKKDTNWSVNHTVFTSKTSAPAELGPDINAKGTKQNVKIVWNSAEEVTDLEFTFSINVKGSRKKQTMQSQKTHCTSQQDILTWQDIKNTSNIHSVHCLNIIRVVGNFILLRLLVRKCIKARWHFHVTSCTLGLNNMVVKSFFFNAICGILRQKKILLNSSAKPKKTGVLSEACYIRTADIPAWGGHCLIHSWVPLQISYMKNEVLKADFKSNWA